MTLTLTIPDPPIWGPLLLLAAQYPAVLPIDFMFMRVVEGEQCPLYLYKNVYTRRYLNIDAAGQCYQHFRINKYITLAAQEAISCVLTL